MFEWKKLIMWFDIIKKNCSIDIEDNFEITNDGIQVNGEHLPIFMEPFWDEEGDTLHTYQVDQIDKRMRLKSHLMDFLHAFDRNKES